MMLVVFGSGCYSGVGSDRRRSGWCLLLLLL